jgi:hypothetical protein
MKIKHGSQNKTHLISTINLRGWYAMVDLLRARRILDQERKILEYSIYYFEQAAQEGTRLTLRERGLERYDDRDTTREVTTVIRLDRDTRTGRLGALWRIVAGEEHALLYRKKQIHDLREKVFAGEKKLIHLKKARNTLVGTILRHVNEQDNACIRGDEHTFKELISVKRDMYRRVSELDFQIDAIEQDVQKDLSRILQHDIEIRRMEERIRADESRAKAA